LIGKRDVLNKIKKNHPEKMNCDTCKHKKATLTCQVCNSVWYCGAQCGNGHDCIGVKDKRKREETPVPIENFGTIPIEVWVILVPYMSEADMGSLSLTSKDTYEKMRNSQIVKQYIWRITRDNFRFIKNVQWVTFIQRVVLDSLITLEVLKERKLFLTMIVFDANFIEPIYENAIPDTVRIIEIHGNNFNHPLGNLPRGLKTLFIESIRFNHPIPNLPSELEKLELRCSRFNQSVDNLPRGLNELSIISDNFSQPVDNLPPGLKKLEIHCGAFNQPIQSLPNSLTIIILQDFFNQPIDNFPASLKYIELSNLFSHPIPYFPKLKNFFCTSLALPDQDYEFPMGMESLTLGDNSIEFRKN
jgi:hypothetical protein